MPSNLKNVSIALVEVRNELDVDKGVIPAVLEYLVRDISSKRSKQSSAAANIAILAVDRPTSDFEKICQRCSIPYKDVIDGYTEWYAIGKEDELKTSEFSHARVHLAPSTHSGAVETQIVNALIKTLGASRGKKSGEKIVVIDSFSSILPFASGLESLLHIRDLLCKYGEQEKSGNESLITLVVTFRATKEDTSVLTSLERVADTHFRVLQTSSRNEGGVDPVYDGRRNFVHLAVSRRKASGRVHFEDLIGKMDWKKMQLCDVSNREMPLPKADEVQKKEEEEALIAKLAEHGLSFRVALSSKEREVRAAAGLPYLHQDENLADSALTLHPEHLQIKQEGNQKEEVFYTDSDDDSSDEDEMFSEDV